MLHTKLHWFSLLLFSLSLAACQTNMTRQFEKVHSGMEKNDVLELMGSPQRSQRFHGKDRWTYILYEDNKRSEKEVHFDNGVAVYVGDTWKPEAEKSAEAVDAKNEKTNVELDKLVKEEKDQARNAFSEYEKKVKNNQDVKYLPVFVEK